MEGNEDSSPVVRRGDRSISFLSCSVPYLRCYEGRLDSKSIKERLKTRPLIVFPSTSIDLVANSTPIVDFDSKLNSFRVNLDNKFDFPTPESPIKTTNLAHIITVGKMKYPTYL